MLQENPEEVLLGAANLRKQLENVRAHGVSPVVAINAMPGDFASEHAVIREVADAMGVRSAVCTHFADGGRGAAELAEARASVGAGFIYAICGEMRTMPGLASNSAAERIDIDANGEVVGLA